MVVAMVLVKTVVVGMVRRRFCGHGVPPVTPLPTVSITGAIVEKDGGVDGDDEDGRNIDDDDSFGMLVDEEDQVDCRVENGHGFAPITPLDSKVYSRTIAVRGSRGDVGHVDGLVSVGLVAGEAGDQQIGGAASMSLLASCGGYGQPMGRVYRCPGCGANMHLFCGDGEGEEGYGQMVRCLHCRR